MMIASSKRRLIVGTGVTGYSVARYLDRKTLPFDVFDTRPNPPNEASILALQYCRGRVKAPLNLELLKNYDEVVISPGVDATQIPWSEYQGAGGVITSDVELFLDEFSGRVITITGSNGKSSVTDMTAFALQEMNVKAVACGNFGIPVLDVLSQQVDYAVIELSSFQIDLLPKVPSDVAVLLNLSEDHLDRYHTMLAYHRSKQRIFYGAAAAVVNRDDPLSTPLSVPENQQLHFRLSNPDLKELGLRRLDEGYALADGVQNLALVSDFKVYGRHNWANLLASIGLLKTLGFESSAVAKVLLEYRGLAHRTEFVGEFRGIHFVNDSKATNVGATRAALNGLDASNLHVLVGGDGKGADFKELALSKSQAEVCWYAYGADQSKLQAALSIPEENLAPTLADVFNLAVSAAEEGDIVLLSPACASLDQFENYQQRGDAFKQLVEALGVSDD